MDHWRSIQICATVVEFLVILTLTLISLKRLQKPQEIVIHLTEEQARVRMKNTSRAVKMVLFSLLLYTTYYPVAFYRFVYIVIFSRDRKQRDNVCLDWETLTYVTRFLPLVNSCLSPFVYLAFLTDYQKGAKKMLCGCSTGRQNKVEDKPTQITHELEGISRKNTLEGEHNLGNDAEDTAL